jgi:hypothetical protein
MVRTLELTYNQVCSLCAKKKDKGVGCAWTGEKDKGYRVSTGISQTFSVRRERFSDGEGFGNGNSFWTGDGPGTATIDSLSGGAISSQKELAKGIDSMTGVGGEDSNSQEFFGSSSAGSFMRQIKSAIDMKIGRPTEPRTSRTSLFQLSPTSYQARSHNDNIDYLLPSRKTGDALMAVYWTLVHPLYPFLDKKMFEEAYDSIWSGSSASIDERVLMCTVNAMFALASQLSDSIKPEQRDAYAKVYFKRAQDLLRLDLWDIGSTELIQCLLIMGQYLQSTNTPHQCWMVIGHAIRVAQGLGFHLSESSFKLQSPREREVARRIWYGCIMMDRVLSMTFGRPAMISKSLSDAVPLPTAIDDEFICNGVYGPNRQPDGQPSMMAFYVKNLHLYAIINDILLALYVGQDNRKNDNQHSLFNQAESSDITRVFEIDQALMTWGQTLPLHLRISSLESSRNSTFFRQAVVCRARFLHARILLFRPILSKFCLPQSNPTVSGTLIDESLAERMVLQCSTLCLKQAHDMIDLIYANLNMETLGGPLPAGWYSILCKCHDGSYLLQMEVVGIMRISQADYDRCIHCSNDPPRCTATACYSERCL